MKEEKSNIIEIDPKLLLSLNMMGFGKILSERLVEFYGEEKLKKILSTNIYQIVEVEGISFGRVDKAASILNYDKNDERRQKAAILYVLTNAQNYGHTYLPKFLIRKELKKLKIYLKDLNKILEELEEERKIVVAEGERFYIYWLEHMEAQTSSIIKERGKFKNNLRIKYEIPEYFDESQKAAVKKLLKGENISILTGGPGTGKTTITKFICETLRKNSLSFKLCAPTGKAAKRLEEATNEKAQTIHRLFKAGMFGQWHYNCLLYTSPSPRDLSTSRMPSSA